jgi:hypothetical protein
MARQRMWQLSGVGGGWARLLVFSEGAWLCRCVYATMAVLIESSSGEYVRYLIE